MSCTHASSCPSSLAFSVSSLSCPSSVVVERSATDIVSHDALDRFRLFSVALNRTNTPTRSSKHWHRHGLSPLPPPSATSSSQSNERETQGTQYCRLPPRHRNLNQKMVQQKGGNSWAMGIGFGSLWVLCGFVPCHPWPLSWRKWNRFWFQCYRTSSSLLAPCLARGPSRLKLNLKSTL